MATPQCSENCAIRKQAEKNPRSLFARIWEWHRGWCPAAKAEQKAAAANKAK